jgi:AcrR family transcriptional regulator
MPKKKVTKKEWLWVGVTFFSNGGLKALNVEEMARVLKCTKGSFYWYFKSRNDYIAQLIDLWASEGTEMFIEDVSTIDSPKTQLKCLLDNVFSDRRAGDFEFYLRQFGKDDQKVGLLINKVEQRRIKFVADLLEKCNVTLAKEKAEILYHFYLGWYEHYKTTDMTDNMLHDILKKTEIITGMDLKE